MSAERDGFSQSIDQISFYGQCMRGQNYIGTEMIVRGFAILIPADEWVAGAAGELR